MVESIFFQKPDNTARQLLSTITSVLPKLASRSSSLSSHLSSPTTERSSNSRGKHFAQLTGLYRTQPNIDKTNNNSNNDKKDTSLRSHPRRSTSTSRTILQSLSQDDGLEHALTHGNVEMVDLVSVISENHRRGKSQSISVMNSNDDRTVSSRKTTHQVLIIYPIAMCCVVLYCIRCIMSKE